MNLKWLIVAILLIAVAASGCGDKDTTTIETDEGQTVEITTDQEDQDNWCAVGTSWKMSDPNTRQEASWEITGSEVIDGVEMCKAEYNINNPDDDIAKIEWMWSEDRERESWIYYNATGDIVYKMETKDGKTTMVGEDGQTTVIESGN